MQADIHKYDYVIVSYDGKKTVCHYIGFVLDEKDDDGDLEVRFLREVKQNRKCICGTGYGGNSFCAVTSVKLVLPRPISVQCHTKRMLGIKRFDVNLECYNMK